MKLLFIHDHPFFPDNGKVYSGGSFPASLWNNYLINFEELTVFGRLSKNVNTKNVLSSIEGVKFYLTDNYSSIKTLFLNYSKLKRELLNLIDEADVVLVRLPSILGCIAGLLAHKQNKKLWVEQVGNAKESLSEYGTFTGKIAAPVVQKINQTLVRKADFISYVTESVLQKIYPSKKEAITTSISNVLVHSILEEEELEHSRFFDATMKIGLIGGFDVRYKGQDILLKAISLLNEEAKSNIQLYFVGRGDHQWILELAEELGLRGNISFIGPLEAGNQVNKLLRTLSLYVQPSLTEGMPRATIEAMSMGCPVIGSNAGGIPDIVFSELIHKRGDIQKLKTDLMRLYFDRQLLFNEASLSLIKARPYLLIELTNKRKDFYNKMNKFSKKCGG